MKDLLKEFKSFFTFHDISFQNKFLIGVSGGLDSMATLNLAREAKLKVEVAHINYQLRGKESDLETRKVKAYCQKHSIKLHIKKVTLNSSDNTQIQARNIRYEFFKNLTLKYGLKYIITGHHRNDDHETFFLNAIRGSGIKGLKSIPEKRGNILRPSLQFSKNELSNYVKWKKIPFNNDSSNSTSIYNRNFMRNNILHVISERFPSYEEGLTISINNLKKDYSLLQDLVDKMILPHVIEKGNNFYINPDNKVPQHCWYHFLQRFGFNFDQITNWLSKEHQSGKHIENDLFRLIKDRDCWIIAPNLKNTNSEEFNIEKGECVKHPIVLNFSEEQPSFPISCEKNIGYFNNNLICYPLTLRKWRKGDFMTPLGTRGKKKISDILIDKKISIIEKENIYVLLSKDEIIWIVNHTVNEKFKVKKENELALKVTFDT
jgi:tRNA(Ile)-lysidine synthase